MAAMAAIIAAQQAQQIEAIKAAGTIIKVEPHIFLTIMGKITNPLVVLAETGIFTKRKRYLTSYKGMAFYTDSPEKLPLPMDAELVPANNIWVPEG